jgi:hypothetical protein
LAQTPPDPTNPPDLSTTPEHGFGSWPKLKERRRWGAFYRQIMPSAAAMNEERKILSYDDSMAKQG